MRHRAHRYRLGRVSEHRTAMLRNMLVSLFRHERIMTTVTRAKAIRPLADHMVTLAKRDSLHTRRQALSMMPDTEVVGRLFDTIAARFADRNGGYTRIVRAGQRPGDAAPMVYLELVDRTPPGSDKKGKDDRKKERKPRGEAGASAPRGKKTQKAAAGA